MPFDMVLNKISRLHLCLDVPGMFVEGAKLMALCTGLLAEHGVYIRERCDDLPEITDWVWSE